MIKNCLLLAIFLVSSSIYAQKKSDVPVSPSLPDRLYSFIDSFRNGNLNDTMIFLINLEYESENDWGFVLHISCCFNYTKAQYGGFYFNDDKNNYFVFYNTDDKGAVESIFDKRVLPHELLKNHVKSNRVGINCPEDRCLSNFCYIIGNSLEDGYIFRKYSTYSSGKGW